MIGIFITGFILGLIIGGGLSLWIADYFIQRKRINARLRILENDARFTDEMLSQLGSDLYDDDGEELPF